MKTKLCLMAVLAMALSGPTCVVAADDLSTRLQKGLFEEEANRNLDAAIQAYQSVIAQFDKDRQLAATAVFRLAECYRKLGKTNDAVGQYQRLFGDFAEQTTLVNLSRQNLVGLGVTPTPSAQAPALSRSARAEQKQLLTEEIHLVEGELKTLKSQFDVGVVSQDALTKKQRELLGLRRQLAALEDEPTVAPAADANLAATDEEQREVQRIKALIQDSPDLINSPDQSGQTPLHKAAAAGQLVVARFLLANKADVNARLTKDGSATPLILAAGSGHKTMVELLLANGADVNASGSLSTGGTKRTGTALHFAAANNYKSLAEVLLANKADVNAKGDNGRTPLHEATAAGYRPIVELLLANGADINAHAAGTPIASAGTPLYYATQQSRDEIVALLIARKADVNVTPANGTPPVAEAVRKGNLKITQALLANGADVNAKGSSSSLLHLALNYPAMLKLILAHKPDLEVSESTGLTPLQQAVYGGASLDSVQLLLAAGANPNAPFNATQRLIQVESRRPGFGGSRQVDTKGSSPLVIAVFKDRSDLVEALLKHGAEPNGKFNGDTALHYAIEKQSLPMVNAILAFRPNTELRDAQDNTPLLRAVLMRESKICEALIKTGADVNATTQYESGRSALHIAVARQFKDIVELLLANKAEVNVIDKEGNTPLSLTRMRPVGVAETTQEELAQLLLKHGANEYLQRLNFIGIARGGQQRWPYLLSKGTNAYHRYTLFEAVAMCYPPNAANSQNPLRFPDFTRIEINRLEPKENKTKDIRVDVDTLLKSGECSRDVWLEWGDVVEIPEQDHPISENWSGLSGEISDALRKCLERTVTFVVKGESTMMKLVPNVWTAPKTGAFVLPTAVPIATARSLPTKPTSLPTFRLRETIYASGVLRASSDVTRVTVKRTDPITKEKLELFFNLDKVDPPTDLWLRDGDVIEIPEK
jgi:cytohesin